MVKGWVKLEAESLNKRCTNLSRWEGLEPLWGCKEGMDVRNTQKVPCGGFGDWLDIVEKVRQRSWGKCSDSWLESWITNLWSHSLQWCANEPPFVPPDLFSTLYPTALWLRKLTSADGVICAPLTFGFRVGLANGYQQEIMETGHSGHGCGHSFCPAALSQRAGNISFPSTFRPNGNNCFPLLLVNPYWISQTLY